MKKIVFIISMVALLVCVFAVGASAVTIYDDFDITSLENIEYRADDVIVFDDGFSCPSVYVFKDVKAIGKGQWSSPDGLKNALDFTYINSKVAPKEYGFDDIDSIDIPQGVTSMAQYACNSLKTIRVVSIPDTLVTFGGTCFQNASGLEYCIMEHGEDSTLTTLPGTMFSGAGLKAFSMPDCITTLSSGKEFQNCKSMKAVYLSKNLTSINGSNACFDYCEKMYLVNDSFVATNESEIPAKPSIYYFPSSLTTLSASAGVFRGAKNINDVLVFGENLTAVSNRVTFQDSPANTIVFLGDMTEVIAYETYYWGTKNLIFANPADKSESDLNLVKRSSTNAYFCYGEGTANHIKELSKTTDATCTSPAISADFCFCGQFIPNTETTVSDALGHSHTIYIDTVYEDYASDGYKKYECDRCGDLNVDQKVPKLFVFLGYSASEYGDAQIYVKYSVNSEAVDDYEKATGKTLNYGVFATTSNAIGNNDIFDENGLARADVTVADVTNSGFTFFSLKLFGFAEGQTDIDLAMGAFVGTSVDNTTEYSYLQISAPAEGAKYFFASYNDVVALLPSES